MASRRLLTAGVGGFETLLGEQRSVYSGAVSWSGSGRSHPQHLDARGGGGVAGGAAGAGGAARQDARVPASPPGWNVFGGADRRRRHRRLLRCVCNEAVARAATGFEPAGSWAAPHDIGAPGRARRPEFHDRMVESICSRSCACAIGGAGCASETRARPVTRASRVVAGGVEPWERVRPASVRRRRRRPGPPALPRRRDRNREKGSCATGAGRAFDPDTAAVGFDEAFHDGQTQPGAVTAGAAPATAARNTCGSSSAANPIPVSATQNRNLVVACGRPR